MFVALSSRMQCSRIWRLWVCVGEESIRRSGGVEGVCAEARDLNSQCVNSFQCREGEGKKKGKEK